MKSEIVELLKNTGKNFWSRKLTKEQKAYLENIYYGYDLSTQCNLLLENKPRPSCPMCGGALKLLRNETCSYECRVQLEQNRGTQRYEKAKQTNLEKYGTENPMQSKEVYEKAIATKIEKYGSAASPKQIESAKSRVEHLNKKGRETLLEKYGVTNPSQIEGHHEKCKETLTKNYGVPYISQRHLNKDSVEIINNYDKFVEFIKNKTIYEISVELGMQHTSVYNIINRYNAHELYKKRGPSYLENEMSQFLEDNNIENNVNNRDILDGKELDFYIPKYKIAIEMNGIYYHSDNFFPDKNYHFNKWKKCKDNNIHLISIFEDDWNLQNDKIKNMLLAFFNKKTRGIPARKSIVRRIDGKISRKFLNQYHLQGYVSGTHYGAFDKEDCLIGVMTFGKTRNGRFELKRFVTDNQTHSGLFSKLFKYAQGELNFTEVVSFSDNEHFTGNVYNTNGFKFIKYIPPDYKYFFKNKRVHKSNFTKDNIKTKFPELSESIDSGMTENEAMETLGIPKIWDCGKCEWVWTKEKGQG